VTCATHRAWREEARWCGPDLGVTLHIRSHRGPIGLVLAAALTVTAGGAAVAHPEVEPDGGYHDDGGGDAHQHGTTEGHLPASDSGTIDVVSRTALKNVVPEKIADVGVLGDYAYLAAWGAVTCKYNGVHVVDISDVSQPEEVAFIQSKEGSYPGEGIQAVPISTPSFEGDVLVSNNEKCNQNAGFGGMNIYDVTDPAHPTPLAEGIGDSQVSGQGKKDAHATHSVFAWDAGDTAYAVMVDNEEGMDVDIVDITNPKKPFLTAEYDLDEVFPQIEQATPSNLEEVFLHDMVVKEIDGRQVMLLSYWDAGYVKVDVTDVHDPAYLGDTDFAEVDPEASESGFVVPSEGNAHQAEFTSDNAYVVGADEDFAPYALVSRNVEDGTDIDASQGSGTTPLEEGETITGDSVFVGRACNGDPAVPAGGSGSQVAVVERGACTFTEKVTNVVDAGGYEAVLVFNRTGSDACEVPLSMSVEGDIPTFGVAPRSHGFAIFDTAYDEAGCLAGNGSQLAPIGVGTVGDTLTFSSYFDGWGYVHLFRNENGTMTELDTYAIEEAHDPGFAIGSGDLSVHEVAVSEQVANRLYFSYYSGGFRVVEIEDDQLVEKGRYIAPGGNNLWGVEVFSQDGQEYVAASDRDHGLWIFQYTP
jgi:hypothetical protein